MLSQYLAILGVKKACMDCVLTTSNFLEAISKVPWPGRNFRLRRTESYALLCYLDMVIYLLYI